jgi:hypothetical protein
MYLNDANIALHHHNMLTRNLLRMLFRHGCGGVSIVLQIPAMMPDCFEGESNMVKKLLGAAAMVAVVFAVVPASAAKMAGCSGDNMMNVENQVEALADGDVKNVARKEIVSAQTEMLAGHMGACGSHLSKAAHASAMK